MANYTTQLRTIVEMYSSKERAGYSDIPKLIGEARTKIFDFPYPIFDESYREPLERKILMHYYTREICEETVGLWKLRLADKMNEIMPYYNQLYESELLKFNPFHDIDYVMTHKGRANERKQQNVSQDTENTTDYDENVDTGYKLDMTSGIIDHTVDTENVVNKTIADNDVDFTENKKLNENIIEEKNTADTKITNIDETENKNRVVDVVLNDIEKTHTVENTVEDNTEHKTGDNDTNLTDRGNDVDTTEIDETTTRTPNLTTTTENDKVFDDLGTGADNRNIRKSESTNTQENTVGNETTQTTQNKNAASIDLYSDTPQGNLIRVDNGAGGETGETQSLQRKLDTGWLTNARQIDSVENTTDNGTRTTGSQTTGEKLFAETTDDDVTHTRNYKQITDDDTTKRETGNETTNKTGEDVVTHNINETHFTHYDIDETIKTDKDKDFVGDKDFSKTQTENTNETERNTKNTNKNENEMIKTTTSTSREQTENNTYHKDDITNTDFTGTTVDNVDYTRDKVDNHVYTGDKDTVSKKKFLEQVANELKHNIRNTDEYINHAVGKISDITYSKMLLEFRETFLNIDSMILEELNDLFFMLY